MTALNKQALSQEELETAFKELKRISEQPAVSTHYARVLRKHIANLDGELSAARARIAELEARTITVKLPELCVGVVQNGHAVMVPYPAGHWFNKTAILEMLAAAGIKGE